MKDQLSDIRRTIWGCPVRVLMYPLYLMLMNVTSSHWQRRQISTQLNMGDLLYHVLPSTHISHPCCLQGCCMRRGTSGLDPTPQLFCTLDSLLDTTVIPTPFEERGHIFHCFYLPAHSTMCRISQQNLRSPLVAVTYRVSSGPTLPSLLLPCPPYDQIMQLYSQLSSNISLFSHLCALPRLFLLSNWLPFLLHWVNSYSYFKSPDQSSSL